MHPLLLLSGALPGGRGAFARRVGFEAGASLDAKPLTQTLSVEALFPNRVRNLFRRIWAEGNLRFCGERYTQVERKIEPGGIPTPGRGLEGGIL